MYVKINNKFSQQVDALFIGPPSSVCSTEI